MHVTPPGEDDLSEPPDFDGIEQTRIRDVLLERMFGAPPVPWRVGRFTVLELVGAGAMGSVYAAYDPELDRKVALKLLRERQDAEGDAARVRMLREAKALAKLNHPHVVTVFDVGTFEARLFIAMEFVQGQTLRVWRESASRSWSQVLAIYLQAARGLAAAHAAGVVHRDFKPENALVGQDGTVRVVDFGLARTEQWGMGTLDPGGNGPIAALGTVTASIAGTPAYMAPEQLRGEAVDARADQFSFCVALYEALAGARPHSGTMPSDILANIEARTLDRSDLAGTVPSWISELLLRGLDPNPEARHASMQALIDELERDPSRRRRSMFGVGGLVLAGALAVAWHYSASARVAAECAAEGDVVAQIWSAEIAAEIGSAFDATAVSYAADSWRRVEPRLAAWTQAWAEARTEVCTTRRIDRTIGSELASAQAACLEGQRDQLFATLDQLARADAVVVRHAIGTVVSLPGPRRCLDERALAERAPTPSDEETRVEVAQLRRELATAAAERSTARFEASLSTAQAVLERAEALGWRPLTAEAAYAVGRAHEELGRLSDARESLRAAYYSAGAAGLDRLGVSAANALVRIVGVRLADRDGGIHWFRLGQMQLERMALTQDTPDLAKLLQSVGAVYAEHGEYEEAQQALESALEITQKTLGADHPDMGDTMAHLAILYHERGNYDEALRLFRSALQLAEQTYGPEHPKVATQINNVAIVLNARGAYTEAIEAHRRALRLRRRALGRSHPDVAASLLNLGNALMANGAHAEALVAYEEAVAVYRDALGPAHPNVAKTLGGIAAVHFARADYDQALVASQDALSIFEKSYGADHPLVASALNKVGVLRRLGGDAESALSAHQRALEIRERVRGPAHADVAESLTNLANTYSDLGDAEAALPLLDRALTIYEDVLGPDDQRVATVLEAMGSVHVALENPAAAVAAYERALDIRERSERPAAEIAETRFALARALWTVGADRRRARRLAEQALEISTSSERAAAIDAWLADHQAASR